MPLIGKNFNAGKLAPREAICYVVTDADGHTMVVSRPDERPLPYAGCMSRDYEEVMEYVAEYVAEGMQQETGLAGKLRGRRERGSSR